MGLDLIVAADSRSGGQDGLAARAAAKLAGILLPRRRVGKISPEFTNLGAPGVKSTRAWVWDAQQARGGPPGRSVELGRALDYESAGGSGSAQRCSTARAVMRF